MIFKQKFLRNVYEFDFQDESLRYASKEGIDRLEFSVPYENINMAEPVRTEKTGSIRSFVFAFIVVFGVVAGRFANHPRSVSLSPAAWLGVTILVVAVAGLSYYVYRRYDRADTMFHSTRGPVRIIRDGQSAQILTMLETRHKARLKELYGRLNPGAPPADELARFKALREMKILDEVEYETVFAKIRLRLRRHNLEVSLETPPADEIRKFEWMQENGIVSPEEFQQAVDKVKSLAPVEYEAEIPAAVKTRLH